MLMALKTMPSVSLENLLMISGSKHTPKKAIKFMTIEGVHILMVQKMQYSSACHSKEWELV